MEYRHSWHVHMIVLLCMAAFGGPGIFGYLYAKEDGVLWAVFVLWGMLSVVLWLYAIEGLAVWRITDEGLEVRNLLGRKIVSWSDIQEVRRNDRMRVLQVRGAHKMLTFASYDCFPRFEEFVADIESRTGISSA